MFIERLILANIETLLFKMNRLTEKVERLEREGRTAMNKLDDVLKDGQDIAAAIQTLSTKVADMKRQLDDVLAGVLTPEVQAKVDAIFEQAEANENALNALINSVEPPPVNP